MCKHFLSGELLQEVSNNTFYIQFFLLIIKYQELKNKLKKPENTVISACKYLRTDITQSDVIQYVVIYNLWNYVEFPVKMSRVYLCFNPSFTQVKNLTGEECDDEFCTLTCESNHMTNFAILMQVEDVPVRTLMYSHRSHHQI